MKYGLFLKISFLSVVFCVSGPAPSYADSAGKEASPGIAEALEEKKYDENTLTPEQLAQCLILEKEMEKSGAEVEKEYALLRSEENDVTRFREAILSRKGSIDMSDSDAVSSFNKDVQEYNVRRDRYNAHAEEYRELADRQQAMTNKYNMQCASRKYYEEDREAAGKKPAGE